MGFIQDMKKKPAMVTAVALLNWIAFGIVAYLTISLAWRANSKSELEQIGRSYAESVPTFTTAIVIFMSACALLLLAVGTGMWFMKMWGFWLYLFELVAMTGLVLLLPYMFLEPRTTAQSFMPLVLGAAGAAVGAYLISWTFGHRNLFEADRPKRSVNRTRTAG